MSRTNQNFTLQCPRGYTLDQALGTCVEPVPPGFVYVNGRFFRACPPGMNMNELGTCIRPVMTRSSFVNEASIQNTILALGANATDNSSKVILGLYDQNARDISFGSSVPIELGQIEQLKLINPTATGNQMTVPTDKSLFLVAQNNRGSQVSGNTSSPAGTQPMATVETFSATTTSTIRGPFQGLATTDSVDTIPEGAVYKLEYATGSSGGLVYALGQPRSKIFTADFNQSSAQATDIATFQFQEPALSLTGATDPYYVGAHLDTITASGPNSEIISSQGVVQTGLDPPPFFPDSSKYYSQRPIDPIPQEQYSIVSEVTSRGLVSAVFQNSYGYILAGQPGDIDLLSGKATSVRYWSLDPGPIAPIPTLPLVQQLSTIDLQFGPNEGDTRIARFDVSENGQGSADTIYVFGCDDLSTTPGNGSVLSFISEQYIYTSATSLSFTLLQSSSSTYTEYQFPLQTVNSSVAFQQFVDLLNSLFSQTYGNQTAFVYNDAYFQTSQKLQILFNTNLTPIAPLTTPPTFPNAAQFSLQLNANQQSQENFASFMGLATNTTITFDPSGKLTATNLPQPNSLNNIAEYNGISWDDINETYTPDTNNVKRPDMKAMTVKNFKGSGISDWCFDPNLQMLLFAVGDPQQKAAATQSGLGASFTRTVTTYQHTGQLQTYTVPANAVDIEIIMWGAGGSTDYTSSGTGGAGAFVSGHLNRSLWNPGDTLDILVGSGGLTESRPSLGGAGRGTRSGQSAGGGRSAVQKNGFDLVTAGGGGGSVGLGQGGAATATDLDAESGLPSTNGGQGGTSTKPGRGGFLFGDPRFKKAPDGTVGSGGSSAWTLSTKSNGGGGGGGGFYGGGAAGYLGYTGDPNDQGTGGGGGTSYRANLTNSIGVSGIREIAPFQSSAFYKTGSGSGAAYVAPIAAGGTTASEDSVLGGHGQVTIRTTISASSNGLGASQNTTQGYQVWISKYRSFDTMYDPNSGTNNQIFTSSEWGLVNESGDIAEEADWSSKFVAIQMPTDIPDGSSISALYVGPGGQQNSAIVVVAFNGPNNSCYVIDPVSGNQTSFVYWTLLDLSATTSSISLEKRNAGTSAFGPIQWMSQDGTKTANVPPLTNIRSIRPFEPGSTQVVFIGDGVRVVQSPFSNTGSWTLPKFVLDSETQLPLDFSMAFTDGQFNEVTNELELVGNPNQLNFASVTESPWTPQYAFFYLASDIPSEFLVMTPWPTQINDSNVPLAYFTNLLDTPGIVSPAIPTSSKGPVSSGLIPNYTTLPTSFQFPITGPNTVFLLRQTGTNDWYLLNFYDPSQVLPGTTVTPSLNVNPAELRISLQNCLSNYLAYAISLDPNNTVFNTDANVAVVIGPNNVLAITFTGLSANVSFDFVFTTTSFLTFGSPLWNSLFSSQSGIAPLQQDQVDEALGNAGLFLGFSANAYTTITLGDTSNPTVYETSLQAPYELQFTSETQTNPSTTLTPFSVALEVNSVFAGSLYHVYAPVPRLAVVEPTTQASTVWPDGLPTGLVVSCGGPFASSLHTYSSTQQNGNTQTLNQPVPFPGSSMYVDFVYEKEPPRPSGPSGPANFDPVTFVPKNVWKWAIIQPNADTTKTFVQPEDGNVSAIRSPANILSSTDGGTSYQYVESLLAVYLSSQGKYNSNRNSAYALTVLDSYHTSVQGGTKVGVGPAQFYDFIQNKALVNAAVSQFNDLQWYANPDPEDTSCLGFFLGVGQFLWELNAVLNPDILWPASPDKLFGVAWVSLDGHLWTTLPIREASAISGSNGVEPETFWMVYNTYAIDTYRATLSTDLGLYMFMIQDLLTTIKNLFGVTSTGYEKAMPVLDFTLNAEVFLSLTPIGRTGPFAAQCTSRDATGTCIKCEGSAQPITISQIRGEGTTILSDFDVCLARPEAPGSDESTSYSAVEAALDAYALASYAGYDAVVTQKNNYVNSLAQSFYSSSNASGNSLIVCPKYTNVDDTPSNVRGTFSVIGTQMQCDLNVAFNQTTPGSVSNGNVFGAALVRRPTRVSTTSSVTIPDWTYSGGLDSSGNFVYQGTYVHELRQLTFVPYDSVGSASGPILPDTCPSTLGLGGYYTNFDVLNQMDTTSSVYGPQRPSISGKIVNTAAYSASGPNGSLLVGPFYENQSLGTQSGDWTPVQAPYDRAVLANEVTTGTPDLLTNFGYQKLAGTGAVGLLYDPMNINPPTIVGSGIQSPNPYLYRLSSIEYPFDSVTTSVQSNGTPQAKLTIGRDPQVFEPGYGPLQNYVNLHNADSIGFDLFNFGVPWPANPVPQEGLGHWYIQYSSLWSQTSTNKFNIGPTLSTLPSAANQSTAVLGLLESFLGFGTLILAPYGPNLWTPEPAANPASGNYANAIFCDDPSQTSPAAIATQYLGDLSQRFTVGQTQNWTQYVPYTGLPWTSAKVQKRYLTSLYSLQNMLTLQLKNVPDANIQLNSLTQNWKFLVSLNFFRPRNWAFVNLSFLPDETKVEPVIGNGVIQQVLVSDQPNSAGQYEFLVPDPYYVAPKTQAFGANIIGLPNSTYTALGAKGPSYDVIAESVFGSQSSSVPKSISFYDTSQAFYSNVLARHSMFHYWTYANNTNASYLTCTLDLFLNVGNFFATNQTKYPTTFDWTKLLQTDTYDATTSFETALQTYLGLTAPQFTGIPLLLNEYNKNPLKCFVWTDPNAQTTRSLWSMVQEGFTSSLVSSEAVYVLPLQDSGTRKRNAGVLPSVGDLRTSEAVSLLRHTYSITFSTLPGAATTIIAGQPKVQKMVQENLNAMNLIGWDTSFNGIASPTGFVPAQDPRSFVNAPRYGAQSNFKYNLGSGTTSARAINVSSSDYSIEFNNAPLFSIGQPSVRQDFLAQNPSQTQLGAYGDPVYGFGLRIDPKAVVPANRVTALQTNADIPADHGYVSMVRTIVDGQNRYTETNSIDAYPHVQRLTYVTKYVPSVLQAYGSIVPLMPMRLLNGPLTGALPLIVPNSALVQNLLNPFRPNKTYFFNNVPLVNWVRPTNASAGGTNANGQVIKLPSNFSNSRFVFKAFDSKDLDLEAPGYWGRQPMPLIGNSYFFDGSNKRVFASVYNQNGSQSGFTAQTTCPYAGYDGLVDNSTLLAFSDGNDSLVQTNNGLGTVKSLRTLTDGPTIIASAQQGDSTNTAYVTYLASLGPNTVIAGQMLLNLFELKQLTGQYMRTEIVWRLLGNGPGIDSDQFVSINYSLEGTYYEDPIRKAFVCATEPGSNDDNFYDTYLKPAYGTYMFNDLEYLDTHLTGPNDVALMTHAEFTQIFVLAYQTYLNDLYPDGNATSNIRFTFTGSFDPETDRPSFTFSISQWALTQYNNGGDVYVWPVISIYRLVLPSPMSNWLGLRAFAPPMMRYDRTNPSDYASSVSNNYHIYCVTNAGFAWEAEPIANTGEVPLYDILNSSANHGSNTGNMVPNGPDSAFWGITNSTGRRSMDGTSIVPFEKWTSDSEFLMFTGVRSFQYFGEFMSLYTDWESGQGHPQPVSFEFMGEAIRINYNQYFPESKTTVALGLNPPFCFRYHWFWNAPEDTQYIGKMCCLSGNGGITNNFALDYTEAGMTGLYSGPMCIWDVNGGWSYQNSRGTFGRPMDIGWNTFTGTSGSIGWNSVFRNAVPASEDGTRESPPLYNLYCENHSDDASSINSITFSGRQGIDINGNIARSAYNYVMCDITNVSWTTRLRMKPGPLSPLLSTYGFHDLTLPTSTHYWGLVSVKSDDAANSSILDNAKAIAGYQASSELTVPNTASTSVIQTVPSAANFMVAQQAASSSTAISITNASQFSSTTGDLTGSSFALALPAPEIPGNYGNAGLVVGTTTSQSKSLNYDSSLYDITQTANLALQKQATILTANMNNATKQTWNVMTVPNLMNNNGSLDNPFQFQSMFGSSASAPSKATINGANNGTQTSWWPSSTQLLFPASAQGSNSLTYTSTLASGHILIVVSEPQIINIGPTNGGLLPLNSATGLFPQSVQGYSLWAFNYTDLAPNGQVLQEWNSATSSVSQNAVDITKLHFTYLQGLPYVLDELYDFNAAYSTLGRSLLIGPQSQSSTGKPLNPTVAQPVILIIAPASPSGTSVGPNPLATNLLSTYSNGLVYSFTEPYSFSQVYSIAFTSLEDGPMHVFYGLDNTTAVSSGAVKASNLSASSATATAPRKLYMDSFAQPVVPTSSSNTALGLDIRQVYPEQSLCIGNEPSASSAQYDATQVNVFVTSTFTSVSYSSPSWTLAPTYSNIPFLPLAGTFVGDLDATTAAYKTVASVQAVPNYEGLTIVGQWPLTPDGLAQKVLPNTVPGFTQIAVDRNPNAQLGPGTAATFVPYDLNSLNQFRPITIMVLLCDVWRNTLRNIVQVPAPNTAGAPAFSTSGPYLPLTVEYYDCMSHNDYDATDTNNLIFFAACSANTQIAKPYQLLNSTGDPSFQSTPWTSQDPNQNTLQLWNPFTGGSFWNTFNYGKPTDTTVSFPPSLWWPTYRWSLGLTDPNNVWPTSVATNPTLLLGNYILFTCTDGSIRKCHLITEGALKYPVIESTNNTTFYNQGINGTGNDGIPTISYTTPGRLYNLLWWRNNWWCTADTASIWTTAPVILSGQSLFPINDEQGAVLPFTASSIKFRPLTTEEGNPWPNARWPSTESHKFNVMKVIPYNGSDCLFVSSVDGEYAIIKPYVSPNGTYYFLGPKLPKNSTGDPQALQFLPGKDQKRPLLYITDIGTINTSVVLGTMPLPLDPTVTDPVDIPWKSSKGIFPAMPLLSLAFTPPSKTGLQDLVTGLSKKFLKELFSSSTITTNIPFLYAAASFANVQDISNVMSSLASTLTQQSLGSPFVPTVMNNKGILVPSQEATGFNRLSRPAVSANDTQSTLMTFYEPPTGNGQSYAFSAVTNSGQGNPNFQIGYGINTNSQNTQKVGYVVLGHQLATVLSQVPFTNPFTQAALALPVLTRAGLEFDPVTRAFFVFNNPIGPTGEILQTGLRQYLNANTTSNTTNFLGGTGPNVLKTDANWNGVLIATADMAVPNWLNSMAYSVNAKTVDNGAYEGVVVKPVLGGPLKTLSSLSSSDQDSLNLFLSDYIIRTSPLIANLTISDIAVAQEANGFAWASYGPFGAEPLQLSFISQSLQALPYWPDYVSLVEPQMVGPSIVAWNPYELKFYAAGTGNGMPDWYSTTFVLPNSKSFTSKKPAAQDTIQELIRPRTIDPVSWSNASFTVKYPSLTSSATRLYILNADASTGIQQSSGTQTGYAIPWTQVYTINGKNANGVNVGLLSHNFSSVKCFGFSSNITAVGGSQITNNSSPDKSTLAVLCWRSKIAPAGDDLDANWSRVELGYGTVTAVKYVGYAWYIATWNPLANYDATTEAYQGQSSLYFASINFNAISVLDAFDTLDNTTNLIQSIEASVQQTGVCAPGYEPNPANPLVCVKKCPTGFTAYGTLCVLDCPRPYLETGLPNECVPDSRNARTSVPTQVGNAPQTTIEPILGPNGIQKNIYGAAYGGEQTTTDSFNKTTALILVVLASMIVLFFTGLFIKHMVSKK